MSGYGGQPPWNDPYGQGQAQGWNNPGAHQQQGWDPNGQYNQAPGYGYGPPGVPGTGGGSAPGSTIAALICTSVATAMCCNLLAIGGIVTSAMAMSRHRTDPASARTLTMWSWVILGVSLAIQVVLIVIVIILDAGSSDYSGTSGI